MDRDRDPQSTSSFGGPSNGFYHPSSSSAASSMRCSTPSSWRSDGKMSTSTEKFLPVTLMYSYKNGNKVLFLEAGKDFVDILLSFLSLPMGAIVRLLYSSSGGGGDSTTTGLQLQRQLGPDHEEAIFKLFNSVEKMEDKKFCTSKKSLVDPPEASGFGSKLLRLLHLDPAEQQEPCSSSSALATSYYHCNPVYYSCGMVPHCVCITKKLGRRCPRHGRKMQAPCTFVEGTRNNNNNISASNHHSKPVETGYVKDVGKFFITDGLGIYAGSKSLALLHKLKIERMSLLSSVDLFIGMDEILRLLKASLVSPNVLQEVFGRLVQTRVLQDDDQIQCRPKKPHSDSMLRLNPAMYVVPTKLQGGTQNCMERDKSWFDQHSRPCSAPNLQKPRPLSMPLVSRKSNSTEIYDFPSNAQRSLVRPISLPNRTKMNYSYKEIHIKNVNKKQVVQRA